MREAPMSARLNRRGVTLPLSILVISLLGVAVAISYVRLSAERRTNGDTKAQMDAFTVAQSGLARYLSSLPNGVRPANGAVTYNDIPNGSATVNIRMIRDTTTTSLAGGLCGDFAGNQYHRQTIRGECGSGPAVGGHLRALDAGSVRFERGIDHPYGRQ